MRIPPTAQAVSLNITVTNSLGTGYILIYPKGGNAPGVSTLNYVAGQTIANAAIVPLGTGGGVTVVAVVSGTQLLIDTNGYYAASASGDRNTYLGEGAGNPATTGTDNVALGFGALASLTSGSANIAVGGRALNFLTDGIANVAVGDMCLYNNTAIGNTAVGHQVLFANTSGTSNTGVGLNVLATNTTGSSNSALGHDALGKNRLGSNNTAVGCGRSPGEPDGAIQHRRRERRPRTERVGFEQHGNRGEGSPAEHGRGKHGSRVRRRFTAANGDPQHLHRRRGGRE